MRFVPLRDRVADAFDSETSGKFGELYVTALLDNWREIARAFRRSLLLAVALIVGFYLLRGAKNAELTLGPLKLTNVTSVLTIIPALLAVVAYECVSLLAAFAAYRDAMGEVVRKLHPKVYENDLELLLVPPTLTLLGGIGSSWEDLRKKPPGISEKVLSITSTVVFAAIIGGSAGFLVYAYSYLYRHSHVNTIAVSVSLCVAVIYAIRAWALIEWTDD
jgi:hypothetical protein